MAQFGFFLCKLAPKAAYIRVVFITTSRL